MNQDFVLNATPANVRRLLRMSMVNDQIKVPHQLTHIAKQNRINRDDFNELACPHTPERETLTQFILDCGLRAVVQAPYHPIMDEVTILNAVRISQIRPITVIGLRRAPWRMAARVNFLSDVVYLPPYEVDGAAIETRRQGALIIDMYGLSVGASNPVNRFLREFPRTILYNDRVSNDSAHWITLAAALCPTMPHPQSIRSITNNPSHYAKMPLQDFALYYNVCLFPEYITSQELLELANSMYSQNSIAQELF